MSSNQSLTGNSLIEGVAIKSRDGSASILVAGDLAPVHRTEDSILAGMSQDLLHHDLLQEITTADLSIVNLECPLSNSYSPIRKQGPILAADPKAADFLSYAGFRIATLANNHIMDMGDKGLFDTIDVCRQAGVATVGAGRNLDEATQPLFFESNGLTIAVIAVAEHEFSIAKPNSPGASPIDPISNYQTIKEATRNSDFALLILHGGNEYYHYPRPGLVDLCRFYVDLGVNAVVCHHPHVVGGMEIYKSSPIVYSTGNFLFDSIKPRPLGWYYGYMVRMEITVGQVVSLRIIPYHQSGDSLGVRPLSRAERAGLIKDVVKYSAVITDREELLRQWNKFCRSKRVPLLGSLLAPFRIRGLNRLLRPLWLRTLRAPELYNRIQCESHRELLIGILEQEIRSWTRD